MLFPSAGYNEFVTRDSLFRVTAQTYYILLYLSHRPVIDRDSPVTSVCAILRRWFCLYNYLVNHCFVWMDDTNNWSVVDVYRLLINV